ncbi:MAG: PAS-domain containing protein [Kiloniellaceae bacterium]
MAVALGFQEPGRGEPQLFQGNGAFERLLGLSLSESTSKRLGDLILEPRAARQERRAGDHFALAQAFSEPVVVAGSDGVATEVTCEWTPLTTAAGAGCYWTATLTPIQIERGLKSALSASEERLAAIFEYSPVDICLKDSEGRYLQVSKRFEELYGVTNAQVRGKLPFDVGVGVDWASGVREMDLKVLKSRQAQIYEEVVPFRHGATECITVKFPLVDAAGQVQGIGTICTDITERKAAERALIQSQVETARANELLFEAVENMTDGFVWFDTDGRLVLCNQQYRDLYPKLAAEFKPGAHYSDLMKLAFARDQLTVMAADEVMVRTLQDPDVVKEFPTFRAKTSEGRWIEARNHALQSGGFIGIRFDVTERVAAEEALRDSEQRFKDFAQSGPGGFWEMDERLRFSLFLDVQTESRRRSSMAEKAIGLSIWEFFEAETEADPAWCGLRQHLDERRRITDLRTVYIDEAGERSFWRINGKPNYDRAGRFAGYRGVAENETAEVDARKRAEAAEERLTDAIDCVSGGFAIYDSENRLVLCNEGYHGGLEGGANHIKPGMTFEEIVRISAERNFVVGLDGSATKEAWVQSRLAAHRSASGDFEITWFDGRSYILTERRMHDGGTTSVCTDITELKRARELAEQANRAKTRFLAAASHDLRQPLHAIELFMGALEATVEGEEAKSIVADLREASNAAGRLLNALLDVSELESGRLEGRFTEFPVQQLLDRLVRVYCPQARERGLILKIVPSSQVIYSDPNLLERIVGNLLSNAVRYTPDGRVLVGCRKRGSKLRIEVWDTGLGIPEAEQGHIFEEFHQLDNQARERQRGLGLGLSIVRRLANVLGHEVSLRSVPGQGSVFAVEIDLIDKQAEVARKDREPCGVKLKADSTVLVIDDDRQVRKSMVRALKSWGCRVQAASDYDEAVEIVAAAAAEIDLIITDYRLPGAYSGVAAAGQLRVLCGRSVPALIVTADQGEAETLEIADHGFPSLRKPVDPEAFRTAVAGLLEDAVLRVPEGADV